MDDVRAVFPQKRVGLVALSLPFLILASSISIRAQVGVSPERGAFEITSGLGRPLYALPDDAAVTVARKASASDPHNADLALKLSKAEAARRQYKEAVATCTQALAAAPNSADLYLERGHRVLGLREFELAMTDLKRATEIDPSKLDSFYHLGLAHYFQGEFAEAADAFQKARDLAKSDDSLIDCTNWLYVSLRRAGKEKEAAEALARITPAVKNTEPHLYFYLSLLHFYQGKLTPDQVLPPKPANPNDTESELSFDTVSYGVGNWRVYHHEIESALPLFKSVVTGEAWNAWGFIGSEVELVRSR
jgi:tetratricopeptide (TPR) repeat protein